MCLSIVNDSHCLGNQRLQNKTIEKVSDQERRRRIDVPDIYLIEDRYYRFALSLYLSFTVASKEKDKWAAQDYKRNHGNTQAVMIHTF